ncbi:MAG: Uma2 family endonuclease [Lachnospiraceae bacterium]|nr:Uma2 family endonuclease [Lachnospiraceae bacterium]
MTIEEMKRRKKELGLSNAKLSDMAKVPLGTVQKVFSGQTAAPRYETLQRLQDALEKAGGRRGGSGSMVRQPGSGIIYQFIGSEVFRMLKNYVEKQKGKCIPFIAPTDVQLDKDDKTILQPDVMVVCDRSKITRARIVGAPDFVAEVLSPGSVANDLFIKVVKYKYAGVREYWIIMPDDKSVAVYEFEKSSDPEIFTFDDNIPVGIWEGKCRIDFSYIYEQAKFMYEID